MTEMRIAEVREVGPGSTFTAEVIGTASAPGSRRIASRSVLHLCHFTTSSTPFPGSSTAAPEREIQLMSVMPAWSTFGQL